MVTEMAIEEKEGTKNLQCALLLTGKTRMKFPLQSSAKPTVPKHNPKKKWSQFDLHNSSKCVINAKFAKMVGMWFLLSKTNIFLFFSDNPNYKKRKLVSRRKHKLKQRYFIPHACSEKLIP
jgi:hypothetical protein